MEITPHIHAIETPLGPAPGRFVNVYLVYGNGITVIDTGFNGSEKLIYEDIRSSGRELSEIELIILTHSHPDHIGAAKAIRDLTGCRVAAHPLDAPAIENISHMLLKSPAPGVPPMVGGPFRLGVSFRIRIPSALEKDSLLRCFIHPDTHPGPSPSSSGRKWPFSRATRSRYPGAHPSTQTR